MGWGQREGKEGKGDAKGLQEKRDKKNRQEGERAWDRWRREVVAVAELETEEATIP